MKYLIFNAPSQDTLDEGGNIIHGGEQFEVSDERADQLLADPNVSVSEAPAPGSEPNPTDVVIESGDGVSPGEDLAKLSREDLNARAAEAGVDTPENHPNKAAVIAAITSQQPAADSGEGQDTTPEKEA